MSTATLPSTPIAVEGHRPSRALLCAGIGSLALWVGGLVVYGGGPGADDVEGAAAAIERTAGRLSAGALLLVIAAVVGSYAVAALSRAARSTTAGRLVLPLGIAWLLLVAASFSVMGAAASVDANLFDAPVSTAAATAALVVMNALLPVACVVAAGFLAAAAVATPLPRALRVLAGVLAVGLLLPPVGWAVLYVLPLWLASAAVVLARRV